MSETIAGILLTFSIWIIPLITAITLHEAAHAWTADRLGDDTARRLGRVSFNPIRHVDPIGTLALPGFLLLANAPILFGWAKPVPVHFGRLNKPKRDMIWVAAAGPIINIALALAVALAMHPYGQLTSNPVTLWGWEVLRAALLINVVLAVFNMLPILPLDGGRILTGLLPPPFDRRYAQTEKFGLILLLVLLFLLPFAARELGYDVNPLASVLLPAIEFVRQLVLLAAGWPAFSA